MATEIIWQDIAISLGGIIGILTKIYALSDKQTVWPRKSSLVNSAFYPPSIIAFYTLELWLTFFTTLVSFIVWSGIAVFRAPEDEDWLGRKK